MGYVDDGGVNLDLVADREVRVMSSARRTGGAGRGGAGGAGGGGRSGSGAARGGTGDAGLARGGVWRRMVWVGLAAGWVFLVLSLVSFDPADWPATGMVPVREGSGVLNLCGPFGAGLAFRVYEMFGWAAWMLVVLGAAYLWVTGARRLDQRGVGHVGVRVVGGVLMAGAAAGLVSLLGPAVGVYGGPAADVGGGLIGGGLEVGGGGGLVGVVGAIELGERFGVVGGTVWLGLLLAVGATVALDVWAWIALLWTGRVAVAGAKRGGEIAGRCASGLASGVGEKVRSMGTGRFGVGGRETDLVGEEASPALALAGGVAVGGGKRSGKGGSKRGVADEVEIDEDAGGIGGVTSFDPDGGKARGKKKRGAAELEEDANGEDDGAEASDVEYEYEYEEDGGEGDGEAEGDEVSYEYEYEEEDGAEVVAGDDGVEDDDDGEVPGAPQVFTPEQLRAKISKLPMRFAALSSRSATDDDLRDIQNVAELEGYQFPGLDLLVEPELNYSEEMAGFVREQAEALERALQEYRIKGEVVGIESGPVITLYEVRLAPGTKVSALSAVSSDLARSLRAVNIRVVANMAGRDTVGVEVPNAKKEKVRLKELMADRDRYEGMALPMFLGKDASGDPLIGDLAAMPHLLIAGTTGSGKSVCMNTVIMSFLYTKKPNELKLVLVDPKMVELSQFKDIPHLMCPVVTEMGKAAAILEWAVGKMEERYELLAEAGCRDIIGYNSLSWEELKESFDPQGPEEEAKIPRKLPYIVFVIDELADLMMTNKEVEQHIVRIAQKARAVGIHLIIATQRPQANVVTGLIKSNLPARVSFKVASGMDSRIVLDQKGGELLLGQGDMLYLSPRSHKLMRAQGTLVDDKEIRRVVRFLKDIAEPSYERQLVAIRTPPTEEEMRDGLIVAQEDPLFDSAVELVLESKRGSVSMLQRRLAIGYTRAARLVEMMGEAGLIGAYKGTVAREVTMTVEEWRAMKAQAMADAEAARAGDSDGPPSEAAVAAYASAGLDDGARRRADEVARGVVVVDDDEDDIGLDAALVGGVAGGADALAVEVVGNLDGVCGVDVRPTPVVVVEKVGVGVGGGVREARVVVDGDGVVGGVGGGSAAEVVAGGDEDEDESYESEYEDADGDEEEEEGDESYEDEGVEEEGGDEEEYEGGDGEEDESYEAEEDGEEEDEGSEEEGDGDDEDGEEVEYEYEYTYEDEEEVEEGEDGEDEDDVEEEDSVKDEAEGGSGAVVRRGGGGGVKR